MKIILGWTMGMLLGGGVFGQGTIDSEERARNEYRQFAIKTLGDPEQGRALFLAPEKTACARCHTQDGRGGKAGPDLFAVGDKFGRKDLIEAVLNPSASIAVGYSTSIIETKSGEEFQGVVKGVTDDAVQLIGGDGVEVEIRKERIQSQRISEVSLMPEGLHRMVSKDEFANVIAYLASLRVSENRELINRGMPATIESIKKPVVLHPFHSDALRFENPVWFGALPGLPNAFLVLEHMLGKIWLLEKREGAEDRKTLFLNLGSEVVRGSTRGLLGMAFHPQFRENHRYYVALHRVVDGRVMTLTLERWASEDGRRDSGREGREILRIEAATNVHYGGGLVFGPDGFLYVGMGDTGPQEDPMGNAQNRLLLRGKIMRIDVDGVEEDRAFRIPSDNPFVGVPGMRPEIWAMGFREPWRFSFDAVTGDLWVGDVGQDLFEEVGIVRRGENHGWNVYEGFAAFSNRRRSPETEYVFPVFAYSRKYGPSVTGGFVYRADPQSSFNGVYIFGDYEKRYIWGLTQENRTLKKIRQIGMAPQRIVSFGMDARGELYVVGYEGTIYRIDLSDSVFE
jgi:putative heme-binding domain-containing protein